MDDELNVLPISSHIRSITPVPAKEVMVSLVHSVLYYYLLFSEFLTFTPRNYLLANFTIHAYLSYLAFNNN